MGSRLKGGFLHGKLRHVDKMWALALLMQGLNLLWGPADHTLFRAVESAADVISKVLWWDWAAELFAVGSSGAKVVSLSSLKC